jgi:ubiquinone/menaquinone biosynthesis C-methylase UbiE
VDRPGAGGRPQVVTAATGTDGNDAGAGDVRDFSAAVARAYDRTAEAWSDGPALVYDRLAQALVQHSPVPLAGRTVLDVGAGTGAASLAVTSAGGLVVAVDLAPGMLRANRATVIGALVGDATALPVATRSADGLVAAFSFNHLPDPAAGFQEADRVCRPGSPVLVAAYAADDDHPAKEAVDRAAAEVGWEPEAWVVAFRATVTARLATPDGMAAAAAGTGVTGASRTIAVDLPDLVPEAMVGWRMGMAHLAPFLATVDAATRARITRRALELLGPSPPPLHRSIVVFAGTA